MKNRNFFKKILSFIATFMLSVNLTIWSILSINLTLFDNHGNINISLVNIITISKVITAIRAIVPPGALSI